MNELVKNLEKTRQETQKIEDENDEKQNELSKLKKSNEEFKTKLSNK
jgi:hypothetical protein